MSRRIAYLFAAAACATFVAPAGADPECFDGVCRMPEVIEAPQAPAADDPSVASAAQAAERPGPAPEPIRPQMRVDDLPRPALRPLPLRPAEQQAKSQPTRPLGRQAQPAVEEHGEPSEPVEVLHRRHVPAAQQTYAAVPHPAPPSAGVIIVAPGVQYGEDGVAIVNGRQDSSWQLCQGAAQGRCIPYNYQPYGASGYRPLGIYRAYRPSSGYVYVPDAKVITLE